MSFCPFVQLVTTIIFFSASDKSRVKWDNSQNSTQKMRTFMDIFCFIIILQKRQTPSPGGSILRAFLQHTFQESFLICLEKIYVLLNTYFIIGIWIYANIFPRTKSSIILPKLSTEPTKIGHILEFLTDHLGGKKA